MEVTGIASLATQMSQVKLQQDVSVAVLKKALDVERSNALALLDALPAAPASNLPPHLGRNIDTTA